MPCTWDKVVMKNRKFTRVLPIFHPSAAPKWTNPDWCEEHLFFFYERLSTHFYVSYVLKVCVCGVCYFLAIVEARSDMGPSSHSFCGVVLTLTSCYCSPTV